MKIRDMGALSLPAGPTAGRGHPDYKQFWDMTLIEYLAAQTGELESLGGGGPPPVTRSRLEELKALSKSRTPP
jgi:hypothetical protein